MTPVQRPVTVLIIDDDAFMTSIYGIRFKNEGFIVESAADGEAGLAAAKLIKPDIILLDVLMPKLNGFEVLERLKADPDTAGIPVVMLTTLGQREDIDRGLKSGAADYLVKTKTPPKEAVAKVRKALAEGK